MSGRQVRLILALGVRRWFNRLSSGRAAKRAASDDGVVVARPPTARRRYGMGGLLVVIAMAMTTQVAFSTWQFADRAMARVENPPPVMRWTWQSVVETARAAKPGWEQRVRQDLASDSELRTLPEAERQAIIEAALPTIRQAAAEVDPDLRQPAVRERVTNLAAALLGMIALCSVVMSLGMGNTDLARPDWDELWLAAQPVSDRVLFTARLAQYTLINPLVWLIVPTAVGILAYRYRADLTASVTIGLLAGLTWAVLTAAVRLAAETWLRQHLAHARIKNLQAVLTVIGMALLIGLYSVGMSFGPLPGWFLAWSAGVPWAALPPGWAAQAAFSPGWAAAWLALGLALAGLVAYVAVHRCAAWSRGGLLAHDGTLTGRRNGLAAAWRPLRVLAKDLLLLSRDRALLVQVLVMPLFMIALQMALNPNIGRSALSSFHAASTFVSALGGWVLISATGALAGEGQALWILAGAPHPLAHALRDKVAMWAGFALAYAVLGLGVVAICLPWPGASALADITMILAGMPILAALAVGIGAAATDPQTSMPNRRVGAGPVYLFMLVMGLFSLTVNRGGTHQRLAMLVVLAAVAWALWQRLRDRLPYLFEPVDRPPRQVDLADGAWAAFAFLVIQGLLAGFLIAIKCSGSLAVTVGFGLAGGLTAVGSLFNLWQLRVPNLLHAVGIRPAPGTSLVGTLTVGGFAGLAAALAGTSYLAVLQILAPYLPGVQDSLTEARAADLDGWLPLVLVVVLAPLCEEFIFRGLLYRGLRRDLSPLRAALASAAVFAVMHPAIGMLPVFGLGIACALAYERTGWLLASRRANAASTTWPKRRASSSTGRRQS